MFRQRALSTTLLIGALAVFLYLEWFGAIALMTMGAALLAQWEFYALQQAKGLKVFTKGGTLAGLVVLAASALPAFGLATGHTLAAAVESLAVLFVIIAAAGRQVFEKNQDTPVATVALTLFGFLYVPFLFSYLLKIMFQLPADLADGVWMAAYLVAVTKVTDIGAYILGSLLGRHKMIPRISPGKSWEGFVGGLACALGTSVGLAHVLPASCPAFHGPHPWILGLALALVSVVGDLAESVIKRDARIKDSGGLIPGIGGCLDLIDSLLFTAPFFYAYLLFVVGP
jgi:phosphatidate cytidylyltransferase